MTATSANDLAKVKATFYVAAESGRRPFAQSFRLIGGRFATSQKVAIPILVMLSLNISQAGYQETGAYAGEQIEAVLIAFFGSWVYFTLAGSVLNAAVPTVNRLRLVLVLVLFITTEMLRTTIVYFEAEALGLLAVPQWEIRLPSAAATALVFFGIVSSMVNDSEQYREIYRQLIERRLRLETTVLAAQETLARTQALLRQRVRQQLENALASTMEEFHRATPRYALIVDRLFSVVDNVVRPASHELFGKEIQYQGDELPVDAPRVKFKALMSSATLSTPFLPWIYFGLFMLIFTPVLAAMPDLALLPLTLFSMTSLYLFPAIGKRWIAPRMASWPFGLRAVVMTALFVAPVVLVMSIIRLSFNIEASPLLLTIYGAVLGTVLGWVLAILTGLHATRGAMLEELAVLNDELYWNITRMQSQMWADQKSLAMSLHSNVQSTLLAAAMRLRASLGGSSAESASSDPDTKLLPVLTEVQKLISDAVEMETVTSSVPSVSAIIDRINTTWEGLIAMRLIASDDVVARVNSDVVTLGVLDDLITEFQTNSVKHGHATETIIEMSLAQAKVLKVVMRNDGSREPMPSSKGLGFQFLESVTLKYRFDVTSGFMLTIQLPLAG